MADTLSHGGNKVTKHTKPKGTRFSNADKWNFFNKWCFSWMNKIVPYARRGDVEIDDLPLMSDQMAEAAFDEFNTAWEATKEAAKAAGTQPSLLKCLRQTYGKDVMKAGLFKLCWSIFVVMGAYFFTRSILLCIRTLEGKEDTVFDTVWKGWILTGFFFLDAWLLGMSLQRMGFGCLRVGIRIRAALTTAVARKCYSMAHLTKETAADAVSFVASDVNKIFEGCQEIHYLWGAPIEAAAILTLLATLVGVYCIGGVILILLIIPFQYLFGWMIIRNKIRNGPNVAERYSIMQELLPAMKLVKYYAWERFFEDHVTEVRLKEKRMLFWNAVIKTINVTMVFGMPPTVSFAVLIPYEMMNEREDGQPGVFITAPTAFTMLSLFNIMRFPLVVLPKAMRCVSEALTAIHRMEKFLAAPAAPKQNVTGKPGVSFKNAVFKHEGRDDFQLHVPEFTCKPGELVAVVGRVGAGKSSLLQAILGNMKKQSGEAHSGGHMAYVPQTAWCQNMSLRDNILFGAEMEPDRYNEVIHACALEFDLQILPKGDLSKAGLRGINLSGGQRQRLNLARCAYFGGDMVLLDNALSAVDSHTAAHIFDNCLKGMFKDKATILITHQVEFLSRCDKVAIMDEGKVLYFGKWNDEASRMLSRFLPASHLLAAAGNAEQPREAGAKGKGKGKAIQEDKKEAKQHSASLPLVKAIWEYMCEAKWWVFCFSLTFFLTAQISRQLADYFIRWWTGDKFGYYDPDCLTNPDTYGSSFCGNGWFYVMWYAILSFGGFNGLMVFRGWFLYWWCLNASQGLAMKSIHRVLYAPLSFFLQTPIGDLLVSFTKDQDVLDEALPDALYYAGIYGLILLATAITVSVTIPLFGALAGVLIIFTLIMLSLYLPAATHLKKLRMGTAGDLVTLVAEALDGLSVIQAYGQQPLFVQATREAVDASHRAVFGAETLNLWLAFYCDFLGAALVLSVGSFGIGQWETLGSGAVGLAFAQSIQMLVFYTWSVRLIADSVSMFGSAEKLTWLANHTPQEGGRLAPPALKGEDKKKVKSSVGKPVPKPPKGGKLNELALIAAGGPKLPEGWPNTGRVEFDNVVMKYAPHLPPALKNVSFNLTPQDKVGVVGRTGSGKSTLLLALYRMFDLEEGRVLVDGVDIASLTLPQLRRALSIIPQEPVVFSGSVRTNLDPFGEYGDDARLWEVIKQVGLEDQVHGVGGLDAKIDGTSSAWSLGQQQLVCLARAALKSVPVLCLDEATAAMDPHTEEEVLATCDRIFKDRTTITIAHRLDTVIRSDQVIVMDAGRLTEMAPPSQLLADRNSAFSALVDKAGPAGAQALRDMASQYFEERRAAGHA